MLWCVVESSGCVVVCGGEWLRVVGISWCVCVGVSGGRRWAGYLFRAGNFKGPESPR